VVRESLEAICGWYGQSFLIAYRVQSRVHLIFCLVTAAWADHVGSLATGSKQSYGVSKDMIELLDQFAPIIYLRFVKERSWLDLEGPHR
jgi:hypothetical protein